MKIRLYKYPFFRYASLGIILFLILLLLKGGSQNYSYLKTLEYRLHDEPAEVHDELCSYQAEHTFADEDEEDYFRLLLCRAKIENDLPLPSDSTIESWGISCEKRGNMSLYADCIELLGDVSLKKKDVEVAAALYKKAIVIGHTSRLSIEKDRNIEYALFLLVIIVLIVCALGFWSLSHKRNAELVRKVKIQSFLQRKYESSKQYIDDNLNTIASLKEQLNSASNKLDQRETSFIQLQKANLVIKNEEQEIKKGRISTSLSLIRHSKCAEKFYSASTNSRVILTKNDWDVLSELVIKEFPFLMNRLEQISNVTSTEKKVCLLMLLDVGTLEMATIAKLKMSSISSAKKNLYEKLTGLAGSAKDLSQEIINIVSLSL